MQVFVNQQSCELEDEATLSDALLAVAARPPFAAAVNLQFVPKSLYATTRLAEGDQIEVIAPITGG
ncbi:MAG: sulfur carrier protein ThiS [Pseudomonadota bacterium]